MRHPLRGRTVLVTGGGGGIGRLMALGAARRGARVVIWDLSEAAGAAARDEIRAEGGNAESFSVDVSEREAVAAAAQRTGDVDVVINDAGVVTGQRLMDATEEGIERTFRVNALSLYWVTRAFLGGMIARHRGTVVTVASAAGMVGVARQTDYSASKFAAFGFAESLRAEMRKERTGVTSLVVCPYYIDTGMFEGVRTKCPPLLPILRPGRVAEKVLDAIESGRGQLVMPPFVRITPLARALPTRAFDWLVDALGINDSMDRFVGRANRAHGGRTP
ncbi:SDR family oxidoreductase [Schaalia naturae]|uniref:SDR family oxidoreductase n=1 Tax=Schaalia naturae TaxID=635203 RepID=A0ABW2SPV2_9ACTO